jgi:hypothetical protein
MCKLIVDEAMKEGEGLYPGYIEGIVHELCSACDQVETLAHQNCTDQLGNQPKAVARVEILATTATGVHQEAESRHKNLPRVD